MKRFLLIFNLLVFMLLTTLAMAQVGFTQKGMASYYSDKFHGRNTASGQKYNKNEYTCAHRDLAFGTMLRVQNLRNGRETIVKVIDRGPYKSNRIIDLSKAAAYQLNILQTGTAMVHIEVVGQDGRITQPVETEKNQETEKETAKPDAEPKKEPVAAKETPKTEPKPEVKPEPKPEPKPIQPKTAAWFDNPGVYTSKGQPAQTEAFGLQMGVFSTHDNAEYQCLELNKAGYSKVFIQVSPKKSDPSKMDYKVILGSYATAEIAKANIEEVKKKGFDALVTKHLGHDEAPKPTYQNADPEAAKKFLHKGVYTTAGSAANLRKFSIQIGSFADLDNARQVAAEVEKAGFKDVFIKVEHPHSAEKTFKVIVGNFENREEADKLLPELNKKSFQGFVLGHL